MRRNCRVGQGAIVEVFTGDISFFQRTAVHVYLPLDNMHTVPRQADYTLDIALRRIEGVMEDNDVATLDRLQLVDELVDEDAFLILQAGEHARAFHANRLIKKDDKERRETQSKKKVATPTPEHAWAAIRLKRLFSVRSCHRVTVKVTCCGIPRGLSSPVTRRPRYSGATVLWRRFVPVIEAVS